MRTEQIEEAPSFLDDGFKIKRKSKCETGDASMHLEEVDRSKNLMDDSMVYLKVPDMNVSQVKFDDHRTMMQSESSLIMIKRTFSD